MSIWQGERDSTDMGYPGYGPFDYTILSNPEVASAALRQSANLTSEKVSGVQVDSATFQPSPKEEDRSQDRRFAVATPVGLLVGVLDGHGGHEAADLVLEQLPKQLLASLSAPNFQPSDLPKLFGAAIRDIDDRITQDILNIVPGGAEALEAMSAEEVDELTVASHDKILLGMTGTTAMVALVDEKKENIWIAHVGDCQAILGTKGEDSTWTTQVINVNHNGAVESEAERIRAAHPGEDGAVTRDRVLGAIAVTRAIGDQTFKLPATYIKRLFLSPKAPAYRTQSNIEKVVVPNILTPPYLTAEADLHHISLAPTSTPGSATTAERVLILCSDGLATLALENSEIDFRKLDKEVVRKTKDKLEAEAAEMWVRVAGQHLGEGAEANLALEVLKNALANGDFNDIKRMSRWMTVESPDRWMDDTTVTVLRL